MNSGARSVSGGSIVALSLSLLAGCLQDGTGISPDGGADSGLATGDAQVGSVDASVPGSDGSAADGAVGADGGVDAAYPIPTGTWTNVTANLAGLDSECGNMTSVTSKPDEDMLIAGIAQHGLWASTDGAGSWHRLGTGAGSAVITNRPTKIVFDPATAGRYYEAGIYNNGGVYLTTDDGVTFTQLGNVTAIDLVSVDFTDPDRKTLVAGGHEQSQTLFRSTDGGQTWAPIGGGLPSNTNCTHPLVVDAQTHLVGCGGYGGGPTGVYRTTDGGGSWTKITASGGSAAPLKASDGSIYWMNANNAGMARSTDSGQTWVDVVGAGVVQTIDPIELPDGRIAALGAEYVMASADHGVTWYPITSHLPGQPADAAPLVLSGVAYSARQKALFIWYFSCTVPTAPIPATAIMRYDFDYAAP